MNRPPPRQPQNLMLVDPQTRMVVGSVPTEALRRVKAIRQGAYPGGSIEPADEPDLSWATESEMPARHPGGEDAPGQALRPLSGAPANNRGNTVFFNPTDFDVSIAAEYEQVQLVVETPRGAADEAEDILVTLGREWVNAEAPFVATPLHRNVTYHTAIVEWGVGNANFRAEIDWQRGCTFAVCASYVRVSVRSRLVITNPGWPVPPSEALAAGIGYGRTDNDIKFTQFVNLDAAGAGATAELETPRFATAFGVTATTNLPLVDVLLLVGNNLNDEMGFRYQGTTNAEVQGPNMFPVPASANRLTITNQSGVFLNIAIVWNLSL